MTDKKRNVVGKNRKCIISNPLIESEVHFYAIFGQ